MKIWFIQRRIHGGPPGSFKSMNSRFFGAPTNAKPLETKKSPPGQIPEYAPGFPGLLCWFTYDYPPPFLIKYLTILKGAVDVTLIYMQVAYPIPNSVLKYIFF